MILLRGRECRDATTPSACEEKLKTTMNIFLGKNESDRAVIADLRDIKHLLVAGKTGSGKTEFLRAIVREFINEYKSDEIKFCYFSDCWFLLKDEIPSEYLLFGVEKSIAKDETEAGVLLSDILQKLHARADRKKTGGLCDADRTSPEIILLFDNNAFYCNSENNAKLAEILKNGSDLGIHVVFSLQHVSEKDEEKIKLFPSVLCGELCSEKQTKIILGAGGLKVWQQFWFMLKSPAFNCLVKAS